MTNYALKPPQVPLQNPPWQEVKEKRKQQLAAVRNRHRLMYQLMRKMSSQNRY